MKKEIKTRQQLIERLNNIDRKCIDEGLHFHDLKTLYEAKEYKLSSRDKADIKKVAAIEDDPETLKAYIDSKAVEESFEDGFNNDIIDYKNYQIEYNFYGMGEYTVQYCGDDLVFNSIEEAKQFIDEISEEDNLELTSDDMNGGYWYESLEEDLTSDEDIRNYAKELVKANFPRLKSHVTRSYNNYVKEYGKKGAIDTLKYIYFYVYLTGDEEAFDNDDYLYSLVHQIERNNNPNNEFKDFSEYLWYYIREYIREYFSKKYLKKEYEIKDLKESIERYSDVIPREERKFWYFTTHGVQPGSIPDDLNVLEIKDTPNGTFVALDGVLNTSELRKYDMKEKAPLDESLDSDDNITGNTWQEFISNIEDQTKYDVDSSYKRRPEKWIELINKETGDIFDAEVTKYFDGSYELMLYNVTPKYESLKESILTNDEYDYFNVYDEHGLVGEFPTYEDAKNACGEGCTINGVIQYGGNEYEETPLNEDVEDKYSEFDVYISIDWELDGSYEEREEIGEFGGRDGWDNIGDDFRSFLENSDFEGVEEIDAANIYGDYENINGLLYITFKDECTIKEAEERVYNILYKWDYKDTVWYEFNGPKRDVDDWDSWEAEFNVNINGVEVLKIEPNTEE